MQKFEQEQEQGCVHIATVRPASHWKSYAHRVRKALELDELSQRMRSLEQDNASLHSHVDSRNAEIVHLRTVIQGLHSPSGHCLPALPPPDNPPPFGLPNPDEVRSLLSPDMATKSFIMHGVQIKPPIELLLVMHALVLQHAVQ